MSRRCYRSRPSCQSRSCYRPSCRILLYDRPSCHRGWSQTSDLLTMCYRPPHNSAAPRTRQARRPRSSLPPFCAYDACCPLLPVETCSNVSSLHPRTACFRVSSCCWIKTGYHQSPSQSPTTSTQFHVLGSPPFGSNGQCNMGHQRATSLLWRERHDHWPLVLYR